MISRRMEHPHSRPASPVSVASLDGFSKRHSRLVFRQRLQGGLSAPSHLIFCFLHAFCHPGQRFDKSNVVYDSHKHLKSDEGVVNDKPFIRGRLHTRNPIEGFNDWLDFAFPILIIIILPFDNG